MLLVQLPPFSCRLSVLRVLQARELQQQASGWRRETRRPQAGAAGKAAQDQTRTSADSAPHTQSVHSS